MFYETFKKLCKAKGESVSYACSQIGFSKATSTKWKNTGAVPTTKNLQLIANYFGVPVSCLLENEQKNKPTEEHPDELETAELIIAFNSLSPDEKKQVFDYMRFQISQRKK